MCNEIINLQKAIYKLFRQLTLINTTKIYTVGIENNNCQLRHKIKSMASANILKNGKIII